MYGRSPSYDLPGMEPAKGPRLRVLDSRRAAKVAQQFGDERSAAMLDRITRCKRQQLSEMTRFQTLCDRYDNLYYPTAMTTGGADHWPDDPNLEVAGMAHLSVNTYPVYVDIPAALLTVTPIENMLPMNPESDDDKRLAAQVERVYFSWKKKVAFELKDHKLAVTKGLYGRAAWKVNWDEDLGYPMADIVDQPRNLWLGWADTNYNRLEWAIYAYEASPESIMENWGFDVSSIEDDTGEQYQPRDRYPIVVPPGLTPTQTYSPPLRDWQNNDLIQRLEIHDYWYRKPKGKPKLGKRTDFVTWNAVVVGNVMVKDMPHAEYDGLMPYIPVMNSYVPGMPNGRPFLYDVEQLIREKDERLSAAATIIGKSIKGKFFQLIGPEADKVPQGFKLKPDEVVAPGAGNRVESVDPWMPEFQIEQYLDRIDRELQDTSGLNDLLRGLAPAQVLSSSKAIAGLVANYETRITMPRDLHYKGRADCWKLVTVVWANKADSRMREVFQHVSEIEQKYPTLTPRDDLETMTMAINGMNAKVLSQRTAMDMVGREDPESEQADIREERTDASLFPADVLQQATLMNTLMQIAAMQAQMQAQQQPPPGGGAPGAQPGPGQTGSTALNGPGEQPIPPVSAQPGNAQEMALQRLQGAQPAAALGPGYNAVTQTQLSGVPGQQPKSRILLQQPIGPQAGG